MRERGCACAPGWTVFLIDGALVGVIGLVVVTIGHWGELIAFLARLFMGF